MKICTLICEENSDARCGADVILCSSVEFARKKMNTAYKKSIELLRIDVSRQEDDYHSECGDMSASIVNGLDSFSWRIEELPIESDGTPLPGADVAIEVSGGLVQNVYANGPVSVEVYDLDSSDFSTEEELSQSEIRERELKEVISQPGWERVW